LEKGKSKREKETGNGERRLTESGIWIAIGRLAATLKGTFPQGEKDGGKKRKRGFFGGRSPQVLCNGPVVTLSRESLEERRGEREVATKKGRLGLGQVILHRKTIG